MEQTLGDNEGQQILVCCSPWGHKKLDMTEQLSHKEIGLLLSTIYFGIISTYSLQLQKDSVTFLLGHDLFGISKVDNDKKYGRYIYGGVFSLYTLGVFRIRTE